MTQTGSSFEIHVHATVPLREDVTHAQLSDALMPVWSYKGAKSFAKGSKSCYEGEHGLHHDEKNHLLQLCWTTLGEEDFRLAIEEGCSNLNELSSVGASVDVTMYDLRFEDFDFDEEAGEDFQPEDVRDAAMTLYVGPTPADIMEAQRNVVVDNTVDLLSEHFERDELKGVIDEIDKLFGKRLHSLVNALTLHLPGRHATFTSPRDSSAGPGGHGAGVRQRNHH